MRSGSSAPPTQPDSRSPAARQKPPYGNAIAQLITLGEFDGLDDAWQALNASVETRAYEPQGSGPWDESAAKLRKLAILHENQL